jgi:Rps23 Pro-64 3,4-dihydroxylase Tpa1-like proline 4-hydroxylase
LLLRQIPKKTGHRSNRAACRRLRAPPTRYRLEPSTPKAFRGGALRLYAIGDSGGRTFIDIEPVQNGLLVFPAWVPHEVMPVHCPSKRFIDLRFASNCWVCRKKQIGAR